MPRKGRDVTYARGLRGGDGGVVVVEPLVRGVVEGGGGVVSAAHAAGVLGDGEEVVVRAGFVGAGEDVRREIEVFDGEVDEVVELLAVDEVHVLGVLEALEVEDEDLGRRPEVELLEGPRVLLALGAVPLLRLPELLALREGPEAVRDVDAVLAAQLGTLHRRTVEVAGLVLRAVVPLQRRPLQRHRLVRVHGLRDEGLVLRQLTHELRTGPRRHHYPVRHRSRSLGTVALFGGGRGGLGTVRFGFVVVVVVVRGRWSLDDALDARGNGGPEGAAGRLLVEGQAERRAEEVELRRSGGRGGVARACARGDGREGRAALRGFSEEDVEPPLGGGAVLLLLLCLVAGSPAGRRRRRRGHDSRGVLVVVVGVVRRAVAVVVAVAIVGGGLGVVVRVVFFPCRRRRSPRFVRSSALWREGRARRRRGRRWL
mmetsp:Transcript_28255/g.91092  ORF Transcript_28255/g.91092 Transcript_28255/m.91092 type:complete len:427 (+) Transcript_28255:59-1339(+)